MLEKGKDEVLETYRQLQRSRRLPVNLENPTTANLRKECVVVFSQRPNERIKAILNGFGVEISVATDIRNIDPDKFRPLRNFIIGEIENPNLQTVQLLAWLLNVDNVESPPAGNSKGTPIYKQRYFQIGAVVLLLIGIFFIYPRPKCMLWNGTAYEQVDCNKAAEEELKAVRLDKRRLSRFKKITKPDTLHYKDIGKVWYMKVGAELDFFTDSGMHPIDERKQLKPITKYIIDKYILKETAKN